MAHQDPKTHRFALNETGLKAQTRTANQISRSELSRTIRKTNCPAESRICFLSNAADGRPCSRQLTDRGWTTRNPGGRRVRIEFHRFHDLRPRGIQPDVLRMPQIISFIADVMVRETLLPYRPMLLAEPIRESTLDHLQRTLKRNILRWSGTTDAYGRA